ncbi:MAG: hypothetical protein AAFX85_18765, partial [Pseudomonadota bacterium]
MLATSLCVSAMSQEAPAGEIGRVTERRLGEISGLVASTTQPQVLWVINDSGNAPHLHAVDRKGAYLRGFPLRNVRNRDWEDLAGFVQDGQGFLVIAEVGDNRARYATSSLVIVAEPDVAAPQVLDPE